jgi:hypothetical protein
MTLTTDCRNLSRLRLSTAQSGCENPEGPYGGYETMSSHVRLMLAAALIGSAVATAPSFAEGMFMAGSGSGSCTVLNRQATPGADIAENVVTAMTFGWAQGFMSALNFETAKASGQIYDLASISPEQQWRVIVVPGADFYACSMT